LEQTFGEDGGFGVFVRSDTNVEDLPGFTGAGLNLTLPNVVGIKTITAAVPRVWASPFTERAFAWRQSHMADPEHVYPAVLLLESVPAEKSGVMVTRDVQTGSGGWLSVAVNEGVGGAVDGQAAESLLINLETGETRLLAQASAPNRRTVLAGGGVSETPVSGSDEVLSGAEIDQLRTLAAGLPERFPELRDSAGRPAPADIEFGFLDGALKLFQIRPFLESALARSSGYLIEMDSRIRAAADTEVDLRERPSGGG
jgi:phosphoenolpyruvate synthase/pyruvate phosphate dikinase